MKETWQFLPQHFITSAVKRAGKKQVLSLIEETNAELGEKGKLGQ
jgi:GTP-binding protein